jgi:hypothetical protein
VCGSNHWHTMVDKVFVCRRCGCWRPLFETRWSVPLDRAGDVPASELLDAQDDEPPSTDPHTPFAKSRKPPPSG